MLKFFKIMSKVTVKVTCSKFMVPSERSGHKVYTYQNESPISYNKKVMSNVKFFSKVGQRSWSRSQVQNLWYRWKGLVIRITHAKYERPIFKSKKSYGKC